MTNPTPQRDTSHGKEVSGRRDQLTPGKYFITIQEDSTVSFPAEVGMWLDRLVEGARADTIEEIKELPEMRPEEVVTNKPLSVAEAAVETAKARCNILRQQLTTALEGMKQ